MPLKHISHISVIPKWHSATGLSICGTLRKGILLEIFMILSNFKPKKSPFWPFILEKKVKNFKIVVLVVKIIRI